MCKCQYKNTIKQKDNITPSEPSNPMIGRPEHFYIIKVLINELKITL